MTGERDAVVVGRRSARVRATARSTRLGARSARSGADAQVVTSACQEQALPLTVKPVGLLSLAVKVPWNPNEVFAPGAIEAL